MSYLFFFRSLFIQHLIEYFMSVSHPVEWAAGHMEPLAPVKLNDKVTLHSVHWELEEF